MRFLSEIKLILVIFLVWRVTLFIIAYFSTLLLPQFGNRFPYFDTILIPTGLPPWIWGFGNFDGVHYLRIALMGYEGSQFSQAFFPLYPLLVSVWNLGHHFLAALMISNIFLFSALLVFYKLLRLDFSKQTSFKSIILLLVFPTSFYFGAVYSESLFLFSTISSLFLIRSKHYLGAGLFAALASATRIFGLLLIPVLLVEIFNEVRRGRMRIKSEEFIKAIGGTLFVSLGFFLYLWYLKVAFGNPLYFLTSQPVFGAERSAQSFILLPQVVFRYIKMLLTVPVFSLQYLNVVLELIFTFTPLLLLVLLFKKIRFSYWIFTFGCLLLPTLTGTLSSMPRYALMTFVLFPFIVEKLGKSFKTALFLFVILQMILVSLFIRGYWVA